MDTGRSQNKRILVVDDEEGCRESFRMILKENHEILTAKDGTEGLDLLRKEKPNLVILDVKLPGIDGIALLQEIRKIQPGVPVIVVSGLGTHKTVIDALKLGATDYLAKPIDVLQVKETVRKALFQAECEAALERSSEKNGLPSVEEVLESTYLNTIKTLCKILVKKDPYTRAHSQQVTHYSLLIGEELGLSKAELDVLEQAALLHDIGKVGIPDDILQKPGALTENEWKIMRQHPDIGQELLEHIKVLHLEQTMVRHHHERWDGKGYPDGLKGTEIPLYARILNVADSFHAMVEDRPYRKALTLETAIGELKQNSGTQFDPELVEVFLRALERAGIYSPNNGKKETC